jgi:hypothetical protein
MELKKTTKNDTLCYTYEVTMLVQVVAPNKEVADDKLEREGGYVSKRDVAFKGSTLLYKDLLETIEEQEERTL